MLNKDYKKPRLKESKSSYIKILSLRKHECTRPFITLPGNILFPLLFAFVHISRCPISPCSGCNGCPAAILFAIERPQFINCYAETAPQT